MGVLGSPREGAIGGDGGIRTQATKRPSANANFASNRQVPRMKPRVR